MLTAVVAVTGCSSSGSSSDEPEGVAAIAGLWELVDDEELLLPEDAYYFRIDADGTLTNIDFRGDEADRGENCHLVGPGGTVFWLGGDSYEVVDPRGKFSLADIEPGITPTTMIVRRDGDLFFTSLVELDVESISLEAMFEPATGVDPVFTPCA